MYNSLEKCCARAAPVTGCGAAQADSRATCTCMMKMRLFQSHVFIISKDQQKVALSVQLSLERTKERPTLAAHPRHHPSPANCPTCCNPPWPTSARLPLTQFVLWNWACRTRASVHDVHASACDSCRCARRGSWSFRTSASSACFCYFKTGRFSVRSS